MPSLMQLPPELHLQIISNLKSFPTTMLLRLTNQYFHNLIPPLSDEQMSRLEHKSYCVDHNLQYCVDCHRLRPSHNFVPTDLLAIFPEQRICIECGMRNESYRYPRGTVFKWERRTRVMCDDCSELPKGSLRRLEDLCQECWRELERWHGIFPLWKEGLGEEEVRSHQAKLLRGTARLHHQVYCRKCWRGFRGCESCKGGEEGVEG